MNAGQPEAPICCPLSLGQGTTLSVATKYTSGTLQAMLSAQGVFNSLLMKARSKCMDAPRTRLCHNGAFQGLPGRG